MEYNFVLRDCIKIIDLFEKNNEIYLNTTQGKTDYFTFKQMGLGNHNNDI